MDLFKAITGKNPAEYEKAAGILVNTPDVELFKKLVKQDDFLFDFVKNNVAKRIQNACGKSNYQNLFEFLEYYSPSYDTVIAELLNQYGDDTTFQKMKNLYKEGILIHTYNDHRIAMAMAPLKMLISGLAFDHPGVVAKSYPNYWVELERVAEL